MTSELLWYDKLGLDNAHNRDYFLLLQ